MGFKTIRIPIFLLFAGLLATISSSTSAAQSSRDPDSFGYTIQPQAFSWVNITGTTVSFPSPDNSFASPVSLGFTFPFYENNYDQVYLSTNGTLSFGQGMLTPINQAIPLSAPPNNFIAPLWTDLDVGGINSGEVRYDTLGTAPNRQFVVTWDGVTHVDTPGSPLIFQVILLEGGNICFQYQTLSAVPASFTAGIEDFHGVDGVENSGGVGESVQFCFVHPGPAARVKITPEYDGGFVANGIKNFQITVHNTGGLGADTYDLGFISSSPGWTVQFTPVGSTASQPDAILTDTGPIPQGGSADIGVKVLAPANAVPGDSTQMTISAVSQLNGSVSAITLIQAAVPSSFSQLYLDSQTGFRMQMYSELATVGTPNIFPGQSSGHTMARASDGSFFAFWEYTYVNSFSKGVSDLKFSVLSPLGSIVTGDVDLTLNNNETMPVFDQNPAAAETSSGLMGVVSIKDRVDDSLTSPEINSNVYLHILDNQGTVVAGPINLTQNTEWRGVNDLDEPFFETPRIAAAGNNFVVTWIDNRLQAGPLEENDVFMAILNAAGGTVLGPTRIADSTPGGTLYLNPILAALSSNRALLAYAVTTSGGSVTGIQYAVYNSSGGVVKPATTLSGAAGDGLDAVQLASGNTLISWVDSTSDQLEYALLNSSYNLFIGPSELTTPSGRIAEYVSVAATEAGYGVLTWMDALATQYIYYALVDGGGNVLTSPMAIRSSTGVGTYIVSSFNGGGNAAFKPVFPLYLPVVLRK